MLVYICCAGGATSSLFAQKIQEAGGEQIHIEIIYEALNKLHDLLDTYKLVLVYGPASLLNQRFIEEYHLERQMQAVWIAPQVRFMKDSITSALQDYPISVHVIDMLTFGRMDGKKALHDILVDLKARKK